jgi:hypothetical protein
MGQYRASAGSTGAPVGDAYAPRRCRRSPAATRRRAPPGAPRTRRARARRAPSASASPRRRPAARAAPRRAGAGPRRAPPRARAHASPLRRRRRCRCARRQRRAWRARPRRRARDAAGGGRRLYACSLHARGRCGPCGGARLGTASGGLSSGSRGGREAKASARVGPACAVVMAVLLTLLSIHDVTILAWCAWTLRLALSTSR